VLQAFRTDLVSGLREGARGAGGGRSTRRTRAALVIAEVALSLVLLTGAGLLLRSFVALQRTDLGFDTEQVLTARVTLRGERYDEEAARVAFFGEAIDRIGAEPGVEAAGLIWWLPLSGGISATGYYLPEEPLLNSSDRPVTQVQAVQGNLFRALGIPLLRGRAFDGRDRAGGARVAIVNAALAAQAWPDQDALGRRIVMPWGEDLVMEVVGVVGDTRHTAVGQPAEPTIYLPHEQFPEFASANLIVRTNGSLPAMLAMLADRVHDIDPMLAVADAMPMRAVVSDAVARPRLTSLLVGLFAALALVLAAVGIYGVVAYTVALRQRELGVRRALGAQTGDVARMVVLDALRLGGAGTALGVAAALATTRVLESLLYGVQPGDPVVLAATAVTLLAVTLLAALVPALRAARVSPTEAIRYG
jgi:predicted permease